MNTPGTVLKNNILIALGQECGDAGRFWGQVVGKFRPVFSDAVVTVGVPGMADISGILCTGARIEIEVKTPTDRQSEKQKSFQGMIERFGGHYIIARSTREAVEAVREIVSRKI